MQTSQFTSEKKLNLRHHSVWSQLCIQPIPYRWKKQKPSYQWLPTFWEDVAVLIWNPPFAPRWPLRPSISSMKMTDGAFCRAISNSARTSFSESPRFLEVGPHAPRLHCRLSVFAKDLFGIPHCIAQPPTTYLRGRTLGGRRTILWMSDPTPRLLHSLVFGVVIFPRTLLYPSPVFTGRFSNVVADDDCGNGNFKRIS